jgi:colanic acid/amylovoran biosynthesis glycosyltransferase
MMNSQVQKPLQIAVLIGTFPTLSETFIFRKVTVLAKRGHTVQVLARASGDWSLYQAYLPLPPTLIVRYLLPDSNLLSTPGRMLRLMRLLPGMLWRQRRQAAALWQRCRIHPMTQKDALRHFIRHLPFLDLKADVLHIEFSTMSLMYPLLPELLPIPYSLSCRGADIHLHSQRSDDQQQRYCENLQKANGLHVVSEMMKNEVVALSGRTDDIWINRPAVDTEAIRPPKIPVRNEIPHIVSVGRLEWKKGYDYLLAALAQLKREGMTFQVQIIGMGSLYSSLSFSIYDLDLMDQVELVGAVAPDEVLRRLQIADIMVLSSHEEGISNAVLEAMASGLPVVTTSVGGMTEVITDGVEGFVVPPRDIETLQRCLGRLVLDDELRHRMGQAARQRVEKEFSLTRQAEIFEQMYTAMRARQHPAFRQGTNTSHEQNV